MNKADSGSVEQFKIERNNKASNTVYENLY